MPSIDTNHFVSEGTWEVEHYRDKVTGSTLYRLSLVSNHTDALLIVGLNAADLDELAHAISAARQDADLCREEVDLIAESAELTAGREKYLAPQEGLPF